MQQEGPLPGLLFLRCGANPGWFRKSSRAWLSYRRPVREFWLGQGKLIIAYRSLGEKLSGSVFKSSA